MTNNRELEWVKKAYVDVAANKTQSRVGGIYSFLDKRDYDKSFQKIITICKEFGVSYKTYITYLWEVLMPVYKNVTGGKGYFVPPPFFSGELARDKFSRHQSLGYAVQTKEEAFTSAISEGIGRVDRLVLHRGCKLKDVIAQEAESLPKTFLAWLVNKKLISLSLLPTSVGLTILKIPRIIRTLDNTDFMDDFLRRLKNE